MTDEEFQTHQRSRILEKLRKRNVRQIFDLYWTEIMTRHYHFGVNDMGIRQVTFFEKQDVINFFKVKLRVYNDTHMWTCIFLFLGKSHVYLILICLFGCN